MMRYVGLCLALFGLTLMACDSSGGGGGTSAGTPPPPIESGVEGTKQVKDLTPADVEKMCDAAEEVMKQIESKDVSCKLAGAMAGAFGAAGGGDPVQLCEAAYSECMSAEPQPAEPYECNVNEDEMSECQEELTVAEIEACMNAAIAQTNAVLALLKSASCATLVQNTEPMGGDDQEMPPECQVIEDKCPEIMDN